MVCSEKIITYFVLSVNFNIGVSDELIELLRYFIKSDEETAADCGSEYIRNLEKKIKPIKNNKKYGDDFMSYQEVMYNERNKGRMEGEAIGEKNGKIVGAIETYFEFGKSKEEIITSITKKFTLSREDAEEYVNKYRPKEN